MKTGLSAAFFHQVSHCTQKKMSLASSQTVPIKGTQALTTSLNAGRSQIENTCGVTIDITSHNNNVLFWAIMMTCIPGRDYSSKNLNMPNCWSIFQIPSHFYRLVLRGGTLQPGRAFFLRSDSAESFQGVGPPAQKGKPTFFIVGDAVECDGLILTAQGM